MFVTLFPVTKTNTLINKLITHNTKQSLKNKNSFTFTSYQNTFLKKNKKKKCFAKHVNKYMLG
jgi:hypothetical protein